MSYLVEFRGPQVLTQSSTGCCWDFLWGSFQAPDHQLESISVFNTFDPCVLDDNAVLKLVVDVTELDPREALQRNGQLFQRSRQ